MWNENYQWHFDYARLAWDTGFSFGQCKSRNIDKNKICTVDIERIIKERDVGSVDHYISLIIQYVLEDEQSKVLDINFVKIFRISQLAVEFLLFCKQYLDRTVVLLKKELLEYREEMKNLKNFNEELESHISTLMQRQTVATFKCSECSRIFSTEDFLNSHIKRRHDNTEKNNSEETEKLNLEIKQLKERLNNTEKLLKEKTIAERSNDTDNDKLTEMNKQFETFKTKIDDELRQLEMQKVIYEESCQKIVSAISLNNEKKFFNEIATQTSFIEKQDDEPIEKNQSTHTQIVEFDEQEKIENKTEEETNEKTKFEERISTALLEVASQIETFKNRLTEIEKSNKAIKVVENIESVESMPKPAIKTKSKSSESSVDNQNSSVTQAIERNQTINNKDIRYDKSSSNESISTPIKSNHINNKNPEKVFLTNQSILNKETPEPLEVEVIHSRKAELSESLDSSIDNSIRQPSEHSTKSSETDEMPMENDNLETVTSESIRKVIADKLLHLNITEECIGVSQKTYQCTLKLIKLEEKKMKKKYLDFRTIKKIIIDDVNKQSETQKNEKKTTDKKRQKNIIKINYVSKPPKIRQQKDKSLFNKKHSVTIRNRSLYDSDSSLSALSLDSNKPEIENYSPVTSVSPEKLLYSNVMNELTNKIRTANSVEIEQEIIEVNARSDSNVDIDDDKKKILYSGSTKKRKVLFNLNESVEMSMKNNSAIAQIIDCSNSITSLDDSILKNDAIGQNVENKTGIMQVTAMGNNVTRNDPLEGMRALPRAAPRRKILEINN